MCTSTPKIVQISAKYYVKIIVRNMTYCPKSSGSDVNDMSFNPNIVKFFNCKNPGGKRSIGFELKSTVCKLRRCRISSGMSEISENKMKIEEDEKNEIHIHKLIYCID